jgi:CysZ protein
LIGWAIPLLLLSFVAGDQHRCAHTVGAVRRLDAGAGICGLSPEQPGLSFRDQRRLLRQHWPLTLGFGAMVLLLTLIPLLNFLAMPAAVIGATLMWFRKRRSNQGPCACFTPVCFI